MTDSEQSAAPTTSPGRWLDEDVGFYWQGERPPANAGSSREWVEVPHEHYIPIPKARLKQVLLDQPKAREAGARFRHLMEMVEGLFHFRHLRTLNELKDDYEYFRTETGAQARVDVDGSELVSRQNHFLANFLRAMIKGNFLAFSKEDYARAKEHTYLLDLPVEIDWRGHDSRLLEDFHLWTEGSEGGAFCQDLGLKGSVREFLQPPAEVGDNALVFYRGFERDQAEGRFLRQKFDLLVMRVMTILTFPLVAPLERALESFRLRRILRRARPSAPERVAAPKPDDQSRDEREAGGQCQNQARTTTFQRRWLKRTNLHSQPLLGSLFRRSCLREPAMRQVITLFRLRQGRQTVRGKLKPERGKSEEEVDWTIRIKMFRHIPLADSEIVFPEKIIRMRSLDVALLLVSGLAVIPALAKAWAGGGEVAVAVLTLLAITIAKLVGRYLRVRKEYVARMTRDLYDKNLDTDVGVLQYLVDSLEEQELKEAVLCYFALWEAGEPLTLREVDHWVERFLKKHFKNAEIDLEVEDALAKVLDGPAGDRDALPLVTLEEGQGEPRYRAKDLDEALRLLDERWDGLFRYSAPAAAAGSHP